MLGWLVWMSWWLGVGVILLAIIALILLTVLAYMGKIQ